MRKKKEKVINYDLIKKLDEYKERNIEYIDALVEIQETYNLDMEDLVEMLPDDIIEHIKLQFAKRKMIRNKKLRDMADMKNNIENILDWLE